MSSVNSIGGNNPVQKIVSNPIHKQLPAESTSGAQRAADKVELSDASQFLQALKSNDIRVDKVSQIKQQIESGTYETDEKLNAAIDKLLDELS